MNFEIIKNKLLIETIGKYSKGIQLAKEFGLNSAEVLNYVYENIPHGDNIFGVIADILFLNNVTWQSIRTRKNNLSKHLKSILIDLYDNKKYDCVNICDFACGYSNYLIETLKYFKNEKMNLTFFDKNSNIREDLRKKCFVYENNTFDFHICDCTNISDFKIKTIPDIVIISGFFDSISDEAKVLERLIKLVYDILPVNGYFIFTNQISHIDIEMVNTLFQNYDKQNLAMETREQDIIKYYLQKVGFSLTSEVIDRNNRYSVNVAVKNF